VRQFLKSLASAFVVLGGVSFTMGVIAAIISFSGADTSGAAYAAVATGAGVGVMLTAGSVYLLAEIAQSLQEQYSQTEVETERSSAPLSLNLPH